MSVTPQNHIEKMRKYQSKNIKGSQVPNMGPIEEVERKIAVTSDLAMPNVANMPIERSEITSNLVTTSRSPNDPSIVNFTDRLHRYEKQMRNSIKESISPPKNSPAKVE